MIPDERIPLLLQRFETTLDEGQFIPAEELCADCPELIDEVARVIDEFVVRTKQSDTADISINDAADANDPGECSDTIVSSQAPRKELPPESTHVPSETDDRPTEDRLIVSVSQFGNFRFLARGGLGEVYAASDEDFGRDIALKFIRKDQENSEQDREDFRLETEIAAKLEHPGVVPIYGMGRTSAGRPFQVMRLIRGESLADGLKDYQASLRNDDDNQTTSMKLRKLLRRFVSVCQTMAYAHSRGIIHRDLKPDNVMLGKYGETLVVDWGLAIPVERRRRHRESGEETLLVIDSASHTSLRTGISGTPSYMSPEQAMGSPDIGPPSDIYSLGSMLYEIMTGVVPYQGKHVRQILHNVRDGEFPPPREIRKDVSPSLEAICIKAMDRSTTRRFATAQELADDIERWLADEPVCAYDEPWYDRVRQWARHHRRLAQSLFTLVLLFVVGISVSLTMMILLERKQVEQRNVFVRSQADFHEFLLKKEFDSLRSDVRLLARRPQVIKAAGAVAAGQLPEEDQQAVVAVFKEFLGLNPGFVQARFLAANESDLNEHGMEKVRVDRTDRGGAPFEVSELQNKGGKAYFLETLQLSPGEVYLSPININQENGQRQWDTRVVRAATPVFSQQDNSDCLGIVIINMHFGQFSVALDHSKIENLQIFLADEKGRFLRFPGAADAEFCFEREINYSIKQLFDELKNFRHRKRNEVQFTNVSPRNAVLIAAKRRGESDNTDATKFLQTAMEDPALYDINVEESNYSESDQAAKSGNDARHIILLAGDTETPFANLDTAMIKDKYKITHLPNIDRNQNHTLLCRRIAFDKQQPDRYLHLILLLEY